MPRELMTLMKEWDKSYVAIKEAQRPPGYDQAMAEVVGLLANSRGLPSHRREYLLREAITTSDFPLLFGDVLDRQMLAGYKAVAPVWKAFSRKKNNKDFRYSDLYSIYGGDQVLAQVAEKGEYPASARDELRYRLILLKYGRQFDISWESMINDDLGALNDTPIRFARAAIRTEHRLVTNQYADDDGTHGAGNLYDKATAGEINGSVALLTIANLEAALEAMASWLDRVGEPIMNRAKYLVVPPALEMTARQILTSASKMWLSTGDADVAPAPFPTTNVVAQMGLTLIVDPYLPVMDATNGNTAWYLFSDPNEIAAVAHGYLIGHERPEIVMKASDKVAVGGGPVGPMSGDFATDNVFYRVRHVFGVTKLDWRATYAGGLVS